MGFRSLLALGLLSVAGSFAGSHASFACPDNQYNSCILGACACLPKVGGDGAKAFEHFKKEVQSQFGGVPLEQWIIQSRNTSINGAMPIPPYIRQALTGYASEDSMNRVRYKIGDSGALNLARFLEQGGYASAVTLIDVVVFRGPSEAADPSIWAHELTHVDQYAAWGVHSFAIQYARDYSSVESPAYAKGNGFYAWASNYFPQGNFGQVQFGSYCFTQAGVFGPGPAQPLGSTCFVWTQWGQMYGQVGG